MEYLEMRGAVTLKADADKAVVSSVLSKMRETEFVDGGSIDIRIEKSRLSVRAEGTISESGGLRHSLTTLQSQLTEASIKFVSSVRWETLVVLKDRPSTTTTPLDVNDQLALAQ